MPYCVVLCFTALDRVSDQLKVYGDSLLNKSIICRFSNIFAHLVSLFHVLVILRIF